MKNDGGAAAERQAIDLITKAAERGDYRTATLIAFLAIGIKARGD